MFINSLFTLSEKKAEESSDWITLITRQMREGARSEGGEFTSKYAQQGMNGRFNFPDYRQPHCSTAHLMWIIFSQSLVWSDNVIK